MKYDQRLKDKYYASTAKAYAKIDHTLDIRRSVEEMLSIQFQGSSILEYCKGVCVLDLGCGTGRLFPYLKKSYVCGVDTSMAMLTYASQVMKKYKLKGKLVQQDLFKFKSKEKFDVAISIGVLGEHVPFTNPLAKNIWEALKPGGLFVFTIVPLKCRWFQLGVKQLLQYLQPIGPRFLMARLNNAAFMGYFAHSKRSVEKILRQGGFKEVQCFTVLKNYFEHYEFVAKK
ncbi:MAG: class I SAM-dependent methyltransferase [Nanoarchaeota archaeon]